LKGKISLLADRRQIVVQISNTTRSATTKGRKKGRKKRKGSLS